MFSIQLFRREYKVSFDLVFILNIFDMKDWIFCYIIKQSNLVRQLLEFPSALSLWRKDSFENVVNEPLAFYTSLSLILAPTTWHSFLFFSPTTHLIYLMLSFIMMFCSWQTIKITISPFLCKIWCYWLFIFPGSEALTTGIS